MGNCTLKPKVVTETGAPAPENPNESLLDDQKLDTTKSLGHFLLQDEAKQKPNGDEKTMPEAAVKEKAAESGDRTAYVETPKQELSTETKPQTTTTTTTDDKNYENKETIDDDLENIEDKKVVEEVGVKEKEKREKTEEIENKEPAAMKSA